MVQQAESLKQELVEKVVRLVHDRQDGERASTAEVWIRQYFRTVPPGDLHGADAETLYGSAMALWTFLRRRPVSGQPQLRIYTPRIDEHGWQGEHTVIEIVNDDMPFLVDSVTAALNDMDLPVLLLIHPVIHVERNAGGELMRLLATDEAPGDATRAESVMHIEVPEQGDSKVFDRIERELSIVLDHNRAAVEDWQPLQDRTRAAIAELDATPGSATAEDATEIRDFLNWLLDNHFTFLGYRNHTFDTPAEALPKKKGKEKSPNDTAALAVGVSDGLGILRDPDLLVFDELRALSDMPAEVQAFLAQPTFLLITKANRRSPVHRPVHMDVIGIKRFNADGQVVGMHLLVGLFTSIVYTHSPSVVPILRRKVDRVVKRAGFRPFSHDGKRLLAILEGLPRDELFQASDDNLLATTLGILHLQERQRTALFLRQDEFERFFSCLVFVPRDRYDTQLRLAVKGILETALQGETTAYYTQVADSPLARLHFIIRTTPGHLPVIDRVAIEAQLADAARAWSDHLSDAVIAVKGEEQGHRLSQRYQTAFPGFYCERTPAQTAVFDIDRIEEALASGGIAMNLYRPLEAVESEVNFKIHHPDSAVPLSEILPMLENMGFRVIGEIPYEVRVAVDRFGTRRAVWIHDFSMTAADGGRVEPGEVRTAFHDAFARVWDGSAENDGFNRLIVAAGLNWRDVVLLRAYAKYLRQAGFTFSQATIETALAANAGIARSLVRLFHARFDPQGAGGDPDALIKHITEALEDVSSPDDDRILRRYLNLILSTLRTNFYQKAEDGDPKAYVSFKIDSQMVEDLPLPRPMLEVWVYSPRVEAIHLRGGKVARGGIRWSDRREDFRTEILGLIKAQMVKNAVIVPVGSKGGFVVKKPPVGGSREEIQAEGIACYQTLMRGLLDITDNLDGETVIPPTDVVRHDADDPYLVVAADKGTATFSDIANAISIDYGFWMGDAFASGGSQGYDHKAMGITARGAWEAVKRHFREIGHDTQNQDFTVAGVGDMAGDVFGNGMLLSKNIRLVAAFNHMHIFIDPAPDAARSWDERQRLFTLPRSSWADYDASLISAGGGVFERRAKRIPVSPEMRALLDITGETISPTDLIKAILRARTDLLWFGGIGTYIRATTESDSEVGDRANDAVRVTARDIRAQVVGEGANLGVTQRARIELALHGGRINTDAIDNSAGVDTSDHEVNIKILLNRICADGDMTMKQRNTLLGSMTSEVRDLVLRNNYLQTQAISLMQARGVEILDHQQRLMRMLEKAGRLDRAIEFLPDDEVISDRQAGRIGLTRPELAVVIAYSKIWLFDELLESDLPDDPAMLDDLVGYFPRPLQDAYREQITSHKLRREIIATHAANSMINRVGGTFVTQVSEKTGMPPSDIARAYIVVRDAFGLRTLWAGIEALDNRVAANVQYRMLLEINRLIERGTQWVLRHAARPLDITTLQADIGTGMTALTGSISAVCPDDVNDDISRRASAYIDAGVPDELASQVARLIVLASTPDVVRLAADAGVEIGDAARDYFAIGSRFGLGWLRAAAESISQGGSHWEKLACSAMIDELYADQRSITARLLEVAGVREDAESAFNAWADTCRPAVERAEQLVSELRAAPSVDLAMLTVASRQFGALKGS